MATTDVLHHDVPAENGFGSAQAIRSGGLIHGSVSSPSTRRARSVTPRTSRIGSG
ncbi:hypothetical protein SHIRM173S_00494 [Streptomyces hirsutus]